MAESLTFVQGRGRVAGQPEKINFVSGVGVDEDHVALVIQCCSELPYQALAPPAVGDDGQARCAPDLKPGCQAAR